MSSSDSDSSSSDTETSKMYDNIRVMIRHFRHTCSTFRVMAADNERPSTSRESHSTMIIVDGQGNEFDGVMKRKLDANGKCDEGAKRSHLTLAIPSQVRQNSDVTMATDSTESSLDGDRLLEEDTERVIQPAIFDDNEMYKTTSAVRKTLHGTVYQWKHMMLVVHRAQEKGYLFRFATEMDAAEKFDDAVLEYQDPVRGRVHRFLQFKHVSVDGMVKAHDLLTTGRKDTFGMVKYFNSWRKIKNNPIFNASRSKEFILCTNSDLDVVGLKAKNIKVKKLAMDDLLKVTVGPKQIPRFYKFVDGPSILRDKLGKEAGASQAEVSEFFEEFILAVNQPNEIELGTMIKNELGASDQFNLRNVDFIRDSFQNMMVNVLKDTGRHSEFLSHQDTAAFFGELHRRLSCHITIGLMLSYSTELKDYDVKFESENSDVLEFLVSPNSLPNSILKLTSPDPTLLTALRVYQTVERLETYEKRDSWIFVHLEKLLLPEIRHQIIRAFESSISHDLLVIDCGSVSEDEFPQTLWIRLVDILEKIRSKKLILVIQENDSSVVNEIRHKTDDNISFIDLAECSRQKLLKKSIIKFQRNEERTSFGEIFGIHDFDNIESNKLSALNKIIEKKTLIQLIRNEEIVIGSEIQGLGDVEKYYIPRTIVEHRVIEAKILGDLEIHDLFAIGGIDLVAWKKLVATENRNQLFDERSRRKLNECYILESGREADHFRNICEQNPERNIHWLQGETGALVWQQSFGSITNLLAYRNTSMVHDNHERPGATGLTEDQLAQYDEKRRIVILTDMAGMGKSTLLTHLAGEIKRYQSGLLVIKVDLTQHTGVLDGEMKKRTFGKDDTNGAVNFLVDKLSNLRTDFERNILKEIVKVTGESAVLIDGYDEICPDYGKIVIDLLRSLAKLPIKRLFVTTRPHTSEDLEREFGTFSYVLQPFDRENQMKFLTRFWGRELNSNDSDGTIEENLKKHANKVLEILSESINSQMQEFAGIPLQLRLVAEAFPFGDEEKLERFESSEKPIYIIDLYKCFVDEKFEIFLKQKSSGNYTNLGQKKYRKVMYRSFLTKHQKLALEALFDEKTVTALMKCQKNTDETSSSSQDEEDEDEGEERIGIVTQVINGKPHFVHRTFAEYFAATFLSKKLKHNGCDQQVQKFFVEEFLIEQEYQTIRAFLNCLLCCKDHAPEKYSWTFNLWVHCHERGLTLYHVAAKERNTGIVRFFFNRLGISPGAESPKQDPNINLQDKDLKTPLMIAVSKHVLALVKCLVEGGADINRESKDGMTALHYALEGEAEINVVKYLVENGAEIKHESRSGLTALHYAVGSGAELDVVKYLVKNGAEIERESEKFLTPLHYALAYKAESNIVEYLVENGAAINRESEDGSTALHWAVGRKARRNARRNVEKYSVRSGVGIKRQSEKGLTPLHSALANSNTLNIVKYLVEKGAEIKRELKDGSTALHCALRGYAKLDVIKYLVETGVEINRESKYGMTELHHALQCGAELDVVKYLVENDAEIERESENTLTPLHYALANSAELDVVNYLVEKGAEINRQTEDGLKKTALHFAIESEAEINVVKYLVDNGAEIEREMKHGWTALHLALRRGAKLDVIKYLVEKGADINRESEDGSTGLHHALIRGDGLHVVKYLVENSAEINRELKDSSSALHCALRGGAKLDVIKYLVKNGAKINHESRDGWTAQYDQLLSGAEPDVKMYLRAKSAGIDLDALVEELIDLASIIGWTALVAQFEKLIALESILNG